MLKYFLNLQMPILNFLFKGTPMKPDLPPNYREAFEETMATMFSNPTYSSTYLFYAHILAQCRIVFDTSLPAAAGVNFEHDHFNLFINPLDSVEHNGQSIPGFNKLPHAIRLGVLKHEALHIITNHIQRRQDRHHEAFNYAADCAINQLIDAKHRGEGWILPETPVFKTTPPPNLTAEQYYEYINVQYTNDSSKQPDGSHGKWDESTGDPELQKDITANMLNRAADATLKSIGSLPDEYSYWLALVTRKNEVDWRQVLRRITGNKRADVKRTLMRPNRRQPEIEWIKGRTKDRKFSTLIVSDVSGSVDDAALLQLWAECIHVVKMTNTDATLIQVDTAPTEPERLTAQTKVIQRKACGGTNLSPALKRAQERHVQFNCVVVTTDGYLNESDVQNFADLNMPVIWLIESGGTVMPSMDSGKMRSFKLKG